jgi:hypothetical protein
VVLVVVLLLEGRPAAAAVVEEDKSVERDNLLLVLVVVVVAMVLELVLVREAVRAAEEAPVVVRLGELALLRLRLRLESNSEALMPRLGATAVDVERVEAPKLERAVCIMPWLLRVDAGTSVPVPLLLSSVVFVKEEGKPLMFPSPPSFSTVTLISWITTLVLPCALELNLS